MLEFKTEKVSDRIIRIYAFSTELMYLVLGDKRAALLDTGSGIGSLKACVEQLTDLPVTVLLTHGHVDHAMGAAEFAEVYMNREDDYIYRQHGAGEFREASLSLMVPGTDATKADLIPTRDVNTLRDLKGGDVFDLGGVHVEVYDCPGHTRGSVVFLIPEERTVLLGDACNELTFLFDDYSTTVTEYQQALEKLDAQLAGKYDTVLLSHGDGRGFPDQIRGVIQVCRDIRGGNTDDIPFLFQGVSGLIAKAMVPGKGRADGGHGNIVYNKHKIGT